MKQISTIGARRLIAIALFAFFMLSSMPMAAVSAGHVAPTDTESPEDMPTEEVRGDATSAPEPREMPDDKREPLDRPERESGERPARAERLPREERARPAISEMPEPSREPADRETGPDKVISHQPKPRVLGTPGDKIMTPDGTAYAELSGDSNANDIVNIGDWIRVSYTDGITPATSVSADLTAYGGGASDALNDLGGGNWARDHPVTDPGLNGIEAATPVSITITATDGVAPDLVLSPTIMKGAVSVPVDTIRPTVNSVAVSVDPIYTDSLTQTVTVTYSEAMDPTQNPTITMSGGLFWGAQADVVWSTGNTVFTATFTHEGSSESVPAVTASVQENSARDAAGNPAYGGTSPSFVVDTYPPTSFLTPNGVFWWDGPDMIVARDYHYLVVGGFDTGTGIDYYEYQINSGGWITGDTFSITDLGWNLVQYRAVDIAGNVGDTSTVNVYGAEFLTGNVAGDRTDGYAFACNITVPLGNTLTLLNYTIIMNSTAADTQYFHVYGTLRLLDGDDDIATTDDGSLITNIDDGHYYYLNVYGGTLEVRNSAIEYAGYLDMSGDEPDDFENMGVFMNGGTANINGGRFHSPLGIGIIFQGTGSYTMNNHNSTYYTIQDCAVGFILKDADDVELTRTVIEDCTVFGGFVNNSMGFNLAYSNFTRNGEEVVTDMGGGLFIVNTPVVAISHVTFYMNDGPGLFMASLDLVMHDCWFYENNQNNPDQMAEFMMFMDEDSPGISHAEVYDNIVQNTMGDHGMVFNGQIGVTAYRNDITVSSGDCFGLALFYNTDSEGRDFIIPDFTVYENDFHGGYGIAYTLQKLNTAIHANVNIGAINVYENNFYTTNTAFYISQYFEGAADSTLGDINFIDNVVDGSTHGFRCGMRYFYEPRIGANIVFGDITATGNTMDITGNGIYFGIDGVDYFDFGTMTYGDVYIADNEIQTSGGGIYYYGYLWYLDSVTVNIGQMEVARNNLSGTGGNGIYIDIWDIGDIYGTTTIYVGNTWIHNNNVSGFSYNIYYRPDYIGYEVHDFATIYFGDMMIEDNNLGAVAAGGSSIYFRMYDTASYMYDYSAVHIGDIIIRNNVLNDTSLFDNSRGIHANIYENGNYMYDSSTFIMGGVYVYNNSIVADIHGIHFVSYYIGYEMYHDSHVEMGGFYIQDNDVWTRIEYALWYEVYDFGAYMYQNSHFQMDNHEITGNTFNNTAGWTGAYINHWGWGVYMSGQSEAWFGSFIVEGNTFISQSFQYAVFLSYFGGVGYYLYGDAQVHAGDFLFNHNTLDGYTDGLYVNGIGDIGTYTYQNSRVEFGNIEFNHNIIDAVRDAGSWNYGLYVGGLGDLGAYTYGNSQTNMGHFQINHNTVNTTYHWMNSGGIYLSASYIGSYMYDQSSFSMQNLEISHNFIDSYGEGIYYSIEYLAYDLYAENTVTFGSFLFNDNTITSLENTGIYANRFSYFASYIYGPATVSMGNLEICNNIIESQHEGMYFDNMFRHIGNHIEDDANITIGHVLVNNNDIVSLDSYGIYIEQFRHQAHGIFADAHYVRGNFEVCNNTINSSSVGIYVSRLSHLGFNIGNSAVVEFGHTLFNGNTIHSEAGSGIYFSNYDWNPFGFYYSGTSLWDNARVTFGNYEINGNTILAEDGYGIHWLGGYVGSYLYNKAYVELGSFKFNENTIYSLLDGIYFYELEYWGYDMYDYSQFHMGNFEVQRNYVNSSSDDGIYFDDLNNWASWMYDQSVFTTGDWLINNNTIIANRDGIYIVPFFFGYYNDGSSRVVFGEFQIMGNDITATGYGINSWWLYLFGYYMYETSYAEFGTSTIMYNTINTTGYYGIATGPFEFGYWVFDASTVIAGDYIVSNNDITANGHGIEFYVYQVGYNMYDSYFCCHSSSSVTLGDILINDNIIHTDIDWGIYVYYYYVGGDVYYDSSLAVGNLEIRNNDITSYGGIYFYMQQIGYDLYNTASVTIGSTDISGNIIDADGGTGIEIVWEYLAQSIYNHASLIMEDVHVYNNQILNSNDGIVFTYRGSPAGINGFAQVKMPSLYIHDNTANSTNYGLRISYYNLHYTFSTAANVDRGIVEIYDCTFTSGSGMFAGSNNMNENKIPFIIRNLEFTNTHGAVGTWGIQATEINHIRVDDTTFNGYDNGVSASEVYLVLVRCTFTGMTGVNARSSGTADLHLVDCPTIDETEMQLVLGSYIYISWILDVRVQTLLGYGVPGAYVEGQSTNTPSLTRDAMTGADGNVKMIIPQYRYDQPNYPDIELHFNPYNFTAWKSVNTGTLNGVSVTGTGQSIVIIMGDAIPPTLSANHYSDTAGTTGDPFTFRIGATDDMGVQRVMVHYRIGAGAWSTFTMNQKPTTGNLWEQTFNLPHQVGTMQFNFVAWDIGGNPSVTSATWTAPVTDNDAPVITDYSPAAVTPTYTWNFTATDNIGLTGVYLNYWITGDSVTNMSMGTGGIYNHTMNVPYTAGADLNYVISATDAAGNWAVTDTISMPIIDATMPVLVSDDSDNATTTGGQFNFNVTAEDDYGVEHVNAVFWFGNASMAQNVTLNLVNGNYTGSITVPENATQMSYYIEVTDVAGNTFTGPTNDVPVEDTIAPELVADNSDTTATTGEMFAYGMVAKDNIGIENAYMVYWFGTGTPVNVTLGSSGSYFGNITVALDATALRYYFAMVDAAGNWFVTETVVINVADNRAPVPGVDGTPTSAEVGGSLTFSIAASDNIGITMARVHYWFGGAAPAQATLSGTTIYTHTIALPATAGELYYYFVFADAAGNTVTTATRSVTISDTTVPAFGTDSTPESATAGQVLTFEVEVADIGGIRTVYALYSVDGGPQHMALMMPGNGSYVGTIVVPEGSNLSYRFVAVDNSGNEARSDLKSLGITVPEQPVQPEQPEQTLTEQIPWLYILIIIILIVIILVLLVTRPKSGAEPMPASTPIVEQPEEPAPAEEPVAPMDSDVPEPEPTPPESEEIPPAEE